MELISQAALFHALNFLFLTSVVQHKKLNSPFLGSEHFIVSWSVYALRRKDRCGIFVENDGWSVEANIGMSLF